MLDENGRADHVGRLGSEVQGTPRIGIGYTKLEIELNLADLRKGAMLAGIENQVNHG
jgi:hypothetical protein